MFLLLLPFELSTTCLPGSWSKSGYGLPDNIDQRPSGIAMYIMFRGLNPEKNSAAHTVMKRYKLRSSNKLESLLMRGLFGGKVPLISTLNPGV